MKKEGILKKFFFLLVLGRYPYQQFCGAVYCCFRKPNVAEQGCQTNNYSISHHEDNKIDDIELGCQTNNDSISHHEDNNHDLHGGWDNTDEATDTNC